MARYVDAIDLPIPIEEAFDFLADFSRTAEWDPGVDDAIRLSDGEIGLGSRFRVIVSFLGNRFPLEYEITEFDRPRHLVLSGGDASMNSVDEITFVSRPGGTRVTYEARIELSGLRRLADPIVDALFQRVGRLAVRGLRERLSASDALNPPVPTRSEESHDASQRRDTSVSRGRPIPKRDGLHDSRRRTPKKERAAS